MIALASTVLKDVDPQRETKRKVMKTMNDNFYGKSQKEYCDGLCRFLKWLVWIIIISFWLLVLVAIARKLNSKLPQPPNKIEPIEVVVEEEAIPNYGVFYTLEDLKLWVDAQTVLKMLTPYQQKYLNDILDQAIKESKNN